MRLPWTLSRYIGRTFLISVGLGLLCLTGVAVLVDSVELIRRAASRDNISSLAVVGMIGLRIPFLFERMLPFAFLVGGMYALAKLTRSQELVVTRSVGVSVWQFLTPGLIVALFVGWAANFVISPLSSALLLRYETLEGKYFRGQPSLMTLSASGLWLRQLEPEQSDISERIIYAARMSQSDLTFANVTVYSFDRQGRFTERLDAQSAALQAGVLQLSGVARTMPGQAMQSLDQLNIPTTLTLQQIQESFTTPETTSFWDLPMFIRVMEQAGFSALRHKVHWNSLLAKPFLLCGMILLGALFSLRLPRRGGIRLLVAVGLVAGLLLYFLTNMVYTLGAAGTLPIWLAAWSPALFVLIAAAGTLMHTEDG